MSAKQITNLGLDECHALLSRHHFGRLAFPDHVGELPMIIPVNYVYSDGCVVLRSDDTGSKFRAATDNMGAAFEIDGVDEGAKLGWSVVVRGRVAAVTDPGELARLRELPLVPWAPGERSHYIKLVPGRVTGRRISLADLPSTWWG